MYFITRIVEVIVCILTLGGNPEYGSTFPIVVSNGGEGVCSLTRVKKALV